MKLVKVTFASPQPSTIFINPLNIVAIEPLRSGAAILTTVQDERGRPHQINVKESVEEVISLINAAL